jgi:8-oxo-dGTP pyrophosphatase MutT (NUDIX family)
MIYSILNEKDAFLHRVVEKLGNVPIDYSEKLDIIKKSRKENEPRLAAGVLLLLCYKKNADISTGYGSQFVFQLIKRSSDVPQAGDLSCPGGMLEPSKDHILQIFISCGFPPILKEKARSLAKVRGGKAFKNITLFLANAVRESWEEIRLNPFNFSFLGPLPSYDLTLFPKTIFPLVGLVKGKGNFHLNGEVNKIVEIPVASFFRKENYGLYSLDFLDKPDRAKNMEWDFPCLIHQDYDGKEEILWGATFGIIMSFLKIMFDFEPPQTYTNRIIKGTLYPDYLTGR